MSGWDILACSDMVMPMYSDGVHDMFNPVPWDTEAYATNCMNKYGVTPNYNYTLDHYGGVSDKDM
jgi:lysosomal Pro-X carboxypeptidase